jgi:hypothetical protein
VFLPDALVCFCAVTIPSTHVAFPRLCSFANVVDMVVTTNDQIHSMGVLNSIFVRYRAELVGESDILIISF